MSDTYRVRIIKGDEYQPGAFVIDDDEYLILDQTAGVFLEGVTAEECRDALDFKFSAAMGRALAKAVES